MQSGSAVRETFAAQAADMIVLTVRKPQHLSVLMRIGNVRRALSNGGRRDATAEAARSCRRSTSPRLHPITSCPSEISWRMAAHPRARRPCRRSRGARGSPSPAPDGRPAVVMVPSEVSEHQVRGSQATLYLVAGHIVGNGGEKLVEGDRVDFPERKGRQVREVTLVRKQALQPWPRSGRPV